MAHPQYAPGGPGSVAAPPGGDAVVQQEEPGPGLRTVEILPQPEVATQARVAAAYGKLPLHFEANQGQTADQVKFVARSRSLSLFLTPTEAVLVLQPFHTPMLTPNAEEWARMPGHEPEPVEASPPPQPTAPTVLRMHFVGANPAPQVVGREELSGKSNYFLGNDPAQWRANIPTYAKVQYREVYPGVDVVYYGNPHQLEYDVLVAPGADPSVITLALTIDERAGTPRPLPLRLDTAGDLVLTTAGGVLRLHKPYVYQEIDGVKHPIQGQYVLLPLSLGEEGGEGQAEGVRHVRFHVAAYDTSKPLIIDPVLSYSTYLGGNEPDIGHGIAVDGAGNAYVTGNTRSADFPITPDAFQSTPAGPFVTKLNATGTAPLVYSTHFGGSPSGTGVPHAINGVAVDGAGNAYVTGIAKTNTTDFPITPGAFQSTPGGGFTDAFVAKFTFRAPRTDVNGDGRADLVWRHSGGAVAFWFQDGFTVLDARVLGMVPVEWQIGGMGDVNGDGRADLVWRNTGSGAVALWLQDGFTVLDARMLATVPTEWHIVGVGDVNGDGRADLVWRNTSTGTVALWLQDGFIVLDARVLAMVPLEWQIGSVEDVNGDSRADLVWRNSNTGAVAFWLQDGFTVLDARVLATVPLEWSIVKGEE